VAQRRYALINKPAAASSEANDLTAAVTWANVPDANITQSSVTQHEAALTLTEAQIEAGISSAAAFTVNNYVFNTDQTVGAGQDNYVLTYDNGTGEIGLEAAAAGGISNLVEDVSPQLGADLDSNTFDIDMLDNDAVSFGTGRDFTLQFNGTDLILNREANAGNFHYQDRGTSKVSFDKTQNGLEIWGGWYLRVSNSTGSDYAQYLHDGTDYFQTHVSTGDFHIQSLSGNMWLRDGAGLKISDSTDNDYGIFSHDGTDFNTAFTTTSDWNITGITDLVAVNYRFNVAETVGAGQDNYVLTYDNGTGKIGLEAAGGGGATHIYKTADETVSNTTTLQDDNDFTGIALDANSWYKITMFLDLQSNSTADIKFQWAFTNAPQDGNWAILLSSTGGAFGGDTANSATGFLTVAISGSIMDGTMTGFIYSNATTGGTMKLQWAQGTATVVNTGLRAGCWLSIEKIS